MKLAIFNPEHDLCLAKGRVHYIPPRSAVDFARHSAPLMSLLYPDAHCTSIHDLPTLKTQISNLNSIIPWGWNLVLKQDLLDRGIPADLLPSDEAITTIRRLQHRASLLPLQPDCQAITSIADLESILNSQLSILNSMVLKAPWSGAGRGLRWVTGSLTPHDIAWADKIIRDQECIIAQPRYTIVNDFALLYRIKGHNLHFIGYSLFQTKAGVYRVNILLSDHNIQLRTGITQKQRETLEGWLQQTLVGQYEGPLGVDLFRTADDNIHVSELNLRHTMGHIAHAYLHLHPEAQGTLYNPAE